MSTLVLLHSPLTTAAVWGALPEALRRAGHGVRVPAVTADDEPPYAARYVADAARQLLAPAPDGPLVLVGHSGAGPLLPLLGAARRAARRTVAGYVFLDAGLPGRVGPAGTPSRLDLLRAEDAGHAAELSRLLATGGAFPDYGESLAPGLRAALRPRGAPFFAEPVPEAPDWPDAPCGYVRLSPAYDTSARQAEMRGWPVVRRYAGHFAAYDAPAGVTDALTEVLARLLG